MSADVTDGVLQVAAAAAACDGGTFAACHRYQDCGIPVRLTPGADTTLDLDLRTV